MKVVLLTFALLLLATSAARAQRSQPEARKFDEFTVGIGDPYYRQGYFEQQQREIKQRLTFYGKELRKVGARPYAITYSPRIVPWEIYNRSIAEMRAGALWETSVVDWREINIVNGGFRESAATELWIVPPGAQLPCPTPTVRPEDVIYCPFVRITNSPYVPRATSMIKFSAMVNVNSNKIRPTFNWEISQGKIAGGQGTDTISVEPGPGTEGVVVARVTLKGFSLECSAESTTYVSHTAFGSQHYLLDAFDNIGAEDELARMDNLALVLQSDPTLQLHLVFYGGRFGSRGEALARAERAKTYMTSTRGLEADRILVIDGGRRHELSGEYWLSLRGTGSPPTRPTVDPHYVKARRTRQK